MKDHEPNGQPDSGRRIDPPRIDPPRIDPMTGLPMMSHADAPEGAARADWSIRLTGAAAALCIVLAALLWYFNEQQFPPVAIVLLVIGGLLALFQSVLVLNEWSRKR